MTTNSRILNNTAIEDYGGARVRDGNVTIVDSFIEPTLAGKRYTDIAVSVCIIWIYLYSPLIVFDRFIIVTHSIPGNALLPVGIREAGIYFYRFSVGKDIETFRLIKE